MFKKITSRPRVRLLCYMCNKTTTRVPFYTLIGGCYGLTFCDTCWKCDGCDKKLSTDSPVIMCECKVQSLFCPFCAEKCAAKTCSLDTCEKKLGCNSEKSFCGIHAYKCLPTCSIGRRPEPVGSQLPSQQYDPECDCETSEQHLMQS